MKRFGHLSFAALLAVAGCGQSASSDGGSPADFAMSGSDSGGKADLSTNPSPDLATPPTDDGSITPTDDGGVPPFDDGGVLPNLDGAVLPSDDGGMASTDLAMVANADLARIANADLAMMANADLAMMANADLAIGRGDLAQPPIDLGLAQPIDLAHPAPDLAVGPCMFNPGPAATPLKWVEQNPTPQLPIADGLFRKMWGSTGSDIYLVGGPTGGKGILAHSADGNTFQEQTFTGNITLFGVWGSSANDIYVVGERGAIFHSIGDGTWTQELSGVFTDLRAVFGTSANDVWAVGLGDVLLHKTGNGMWTTQTTGSGDDLYAFFGVPGHYYAGGAMGLIFHSTGDGNWASEVSGVDSTIRGLWGASATDVYGVSFGGSIVHSTGNGKWDIQHLGQGTALLDVFGRSAMELYAVGDQDQIFASTGDGKWAAQKAGVNGATLETVWGVKGSLLVAGFQQNRGLVLSSPLADGKWTPVNQAMMQGQPSDINALTVGDSTHRWAVGVGGSILFTSNTGKWSAQTSGTQTDLWGAFAVGGSAVWASGGSKMGNTLILHSAGNGMWAPEKSPGTGILYGVWGSSASDLYAVGQGGTILHSTGNGAWAAQKSGTVQDLHAVWGSSASDLYAVGTGVILHKGGNGQWVSQMVANGADFWGVWGRSAGEVYAVGASAQGGIIYRSNGDGCWGKLKIPTQENLWSVWATSALIFVGGGNSMTGTQGVLLQSQGGDFSLESYGGMTPPTLFAVAGLAFDKVFAGGSGGAIFSNQ